MKRICVYCGSSQGRQPEYRLAAQELGEALLERNLGLIYGGASVGIMGAVADTVLAGGGEAIGVIPEALAIKEVAHEGLSEQHVVATMHERKALMADLADGFIALPGGWGTLEEIFEALTWAQLGFHEKPCGLLNVAAYYDQLAAFLEQAFDEQFVRPVYRQLLLIESQPAKLLERFASYRAPRIKKWLGPSQR